MKKFIILLLITLSVTGHVVAQTGTGNKQEALERLEAYKVAWLTKKLNLSVEEAQRFWPVYNRYTEEVRRIRIEQRQNNTSEIEVEEKVLNIRKKYNSEFSKALSAEKVNNFFRTEKEFGSMVKRELQERRMNRQQNLRPLKRQQ